MPTGYTSDIEKGITFNEFTMQCARAFGACISMRDDPGDKPIPKEFKPSTYHIEGIKKAKEKMVQLKKMSLETATQEAGKEFTEEAKEETVERRVVCQRWFV